MSLGEPIQRRLSGGCNKVAISMNFFQSAVNRSLHTKGPVTQKPHCKNDEKGIGRGSQRDRRDGSRQVELIK
jgi:hypothetical protein